MLIRWTQPSVNDLTKICDYLDEHGDAGISRRAALTIYRSAQSLQKFPDRGRPGRIVHTRELVLANLPYIIVYTARQDAVEILRILHGAQLWP